MAGSHTLMLEEEVLSCERRREMGADVYRLGLGCNFFRLRKFEAFKILPVMTILGFQLDHI